MDALNRLLATRTSAHLLHRAQAATPDALLRRAEAATKEGLLRLSNQRTPQHLLRIAQGEVLEDDEPDAPTLGPPPKPKKRFRAWRAHVVSRLRRGEIRTRGDTKQRVAQQDAWQEPQPGANALQPRGNQGGPPPLGDLGRAQPSERFSVNSAAIFVSEDAVLRGDPPLPKYGTYTEILDDIAALGAGVTRQPGRLEPYSDNLLHVAHTLAGSFPYDFRPDTSLIDLALVETKVQDAVNASQQLSIDGHLWQAVMHIHETGAETRLMLTFLTVGGGTATAGVSTPVYDRGLKLQWQTGHNDKELVDDFGTTHHFSTGFGEWDSSTLDPANGYKRAFYRILARCVARRLTDLQWEMLFRTRIVTPDNPVFLQRFLLGVEIGNELDVRHTKEDDTGVVAGDGEAWGDLWFDCASAMRDAADWLPIWLPGLASAEVSKDEIEAMSDSEGDKEF